VTDETPDATRDPAPDETPDQASPGRPGARARLRRVGRRASEAERPGPVRSPAERPAEVRTVRVAREHPNAAGPLLRPAAATPAPERADHGTSADDTPPFGRRRHGRVAVGLVAVLVVGTLIAALFVLPVRAWLGQRQALAQSQKQLDVIWAENKRLEKVYDELQTDAVVEEQARSQFGLVKPGEIPLSVLPAPAATALPKGWPYDQVQRILDVRGHAAATAGK